MLKLSEIRTQLFYFWLLLKFLQHFTEQTVYFIIFLLNFEQSHNKNMFHTLILITTKILMWCFFKSQTNCAFPLGLKKHVIWSYLFYIRKSYNLSYLGDGFGKPSHKQRSWMQLINVKRQLKREWANFYGNNLAKM